MSNKGKKFTYADLPRTTQLRLKNKQVGGEELAKLDKWLLDQTERNRVVAVMDDGTELIAEELAERAARYWSTCDNHGEIQPEVLTHIRGLLAMNPAWRVNVLQAFDDNGDIVNPFKAPAKAKKK